MFGEQPMGQWVAIAEGGKGSGRQWHLHGSQPCSNSMKLWAMPFRATQDRWVMVESSDKMWSTGEGNGKPLQYSCLENPMNSMKRQKDMALEDETPRSVGVYYATGEEWRNNSRKNEVAGPVWKWHSVFNVSSGKNKVWCCKESSLYRIFNRNLEC